MLSDWLILVTRETKKYLKKLFQINPGISFGNKKPLRAISGAFGFTMISILLVDYTHQYSE